MIRGVMMKLFLLQALVSMCLLACAHGGARAAQVTGDEAELARRAITEAASLEGVVSGLADFEARASRYDKPEWDFVLGYAHYSDGRYEQAARHFERVGKGLPALGDYVLFYRASCANRLGRFEQALAHLDRLAEAYPASVWMQDSRVERARSLEGLGRHKEAVERLSDALEEADDIERRRIERLIAKAYIDMGAGGRAANFVKGMAVSSGCEEDLRDLEGLISEIKRRFKVDVAAWLAEPSRQLRLIQSFTAQSQWSDAAVRLERLLASGGLDPTQRAQAEWLLAKSYRWTHRYDDAIRILRELMRSPQGGRFSGLQYTLALIYAKKNDYEKAIAIRRRIMERLPPGSRSAANLAYKIAFLYMDQGRYGQAIEHWGRMASMRGAGSKGVLARWFIGWCYLMKGSHAQALAAFEGLEGRTARRARIDDRVRYWKGRTLLAMGRKDEARATFRQVISEYPRGYYAELARRRLDGEKRTIADFVVAEHFWPDGGSYGPPSVGAEGSPHMARAIILARLGLHDAAAREVRAVDLRKRPELAEQAMWLAWKSYAHDYSYRIAQGRFRRYLKGQPGGGGDFGRFVWQQAYPYAYEPVVTRLAKIEGVDPLLVWSVMRNESAYKPRVISSAGAVGLMQLMPTTAARLAKEAGTGGHSRGELYNPATNVAYGVTYLGNLADMFDGNAVAMIASYNAGEEAVGRWLANGENGDIEEWIEEIPYSETNLYVKKVLTSYWNYQRLYGRRATEQVGRRGRGQVEASASR